MPRSQQRTGARRRGRPTLLASTPTAELRKELERRQAMLHDIIRQRDELSSELEELQSLFGGSIPDAPVNRGPGRPPGTGRGPGRLAGTRRGPGRPPGSGATKRRRGRPVGTGGANRTNLVTALGNALTGKTMSVAEVSEAVQRQGYKTNSANFRTIVNQALLANPSAFRKVARGQYTAK